MCCRLTRPSYTQNPTEPLTKGAACPGTLRPQPWAEAGLEVGGWFQPRRGVQVLSAKAGPTPGRPALRSTHRTHIQQVAQGRCSLAVRQVCAAPFGCQATQSSLQSPGRPKGKSTIGKGLCGFVAVAFSQRSLA